MPRPERKKPNYWFVRKSYGWGWAPATREGWTVIAAHIALLLLWADLILKGNTDDARTTLLFVGIVLLQTAVLIFIAYKTGEPPQWQWGKK